MPASAMTNSFVCQIAKRDNTYSMYRCDCLKKVPSATARLPISAKAVCGEYVACPRNTRMHGSCNGYVCLTVAMAIILATAKQLSDARSCEVESNMGVESDSDTCCGDDKACFMLFCISAAQLAKDGLCALQQQQ